MKGAGSIERIVEISHEVWIIDGISVTYPVVTYAPEHTWGRFLADNNSKNSYSTNSLGYYERGGMVYDSSGRLVGERGLQNVYPEFYIFLAGRLIYNTISSIVEFTYGAFKSEAKWASQMAQRGWTEKQITEAITKGKAFDAVNMVNKANGATRFVHPTTGQSVVIDNVTREILHIGGPGFLY